MNMLSMPSPFAIKSTPSGCLGLKLIDRREERQLRGFEETAHPPLEGDPLVGVRDLASECGAALDELPDGAGATLLAAGHLDDRLALLLREVMGAEPREHVLVLPGHGLPCRSCELLLHVYHRGLGIGVEPGQGFLREALRGVSRVPDRDLLDLPRAPHDPVVADEVVEEGHEPEAMGADLRVPNHEAAEE